MNSFPFIELSKRDQKLDDLISKNLDRPGWIMRFPSILEARFNAHSHPNRYRHLVQSGVFSIVLLMISVVIDRLYRPELFIHLTIIRSGMILSIVAALAISMVLKYNHKLPAVTSVFGVSVASLGTGLMMISPDNPIVRYEPYTFLLIAVIANIALPLRPYQAFLASALNLAIAVYFIAPLQSLSPDEKLSALILLVATSILTLFANIRIETIERKIFLLYLREKLRGAALLRQYRSLDHISNTDALTDLANRRLFDDRLNQNWIAARMQGRPLTLLMIDIDHFKGFNDTYGHPAGDDCLKRVAAALKTCIRMEDDLPARFGGEEFALILPNCDETVGLQMAERLHEAIQELKITHATSPLKRLTISIGVATERPLASTHEPQPRGLLIRSDRALYSAKQAGRNRTCLDEPGDENYALVNGKSSEHRVV